MAEIDDDDVGMTIEEQEEARQLAAENASSELLTYSRDNNSSMALKSLEIATEIDRTEGESYWTPLHYAAFHGDAKLVDALIAAGAHKKYVAANECRQRLLIQKQNLLAGLKVDGPESFEEEADENNFINTPLQWSAFKGHMATTLSLLDAGYSLDDVDTIGNSSLHLACASQNKAVVELLVASGADLSTRNRYQLQALDVATSLEVRSVIESAQKVEDKNSTKEKKREAMKEAQSLSIRQVATNLSELNTASAPENLEEEMNRVSALQNALVASIDTNGAVDAESMAKAQEAIKKYNLSIDMRKHLDATKAQHPIVTQKVYCSYVNKLERFVKAGSKLGVDNLLIDEAKAVIARSFSEFWLFKIKEELKPVECATKSIEPRIDLLEERIEKAQKLEASDTLISTSFKVLERFRSEVALSVTIEQVPTYKMPPLPEETAELNKKQLAAFLEEYWDEDDVGHIKETTKEDGCNPFPLPPGFGRPEDDEEWANNPLKALINTPEGYIWVPSKSLVNLREAAKNLDVTLIRATNFDAFAPLLEKAKVKMQKLTSDIQQLEMKDETDMTLAEAAASKASKKMKKEMKGSKKKG
eukprot:CAMPEP_0114360286 /NCGR_PEP_ID=MMETSP0101-20121206/23724_1 /TAXON_ID=38822 ORGANISM="Pteridomonas danica, Strain PT" /NCGR_SAMPLE_ID=MMETSP0101 /ASSEMBLY_ACC=CAM_ASM_000211 /LENGTH=588 /DNA_ID=CAMNT_0001504395 /DNA_START=22 /DNA_END=1788 /DNA_ORIENTATION=+